MLQRWTETRCCTISRMLPESAFAVTLPHAALLASQLLFDIVAYSFGEVALVPEDSIPLLQNI